MYLLVRKEKVSDKTEPGEEVEIREGNIDL
jgi:hypothetical protein